MTPADRRKAEEIKRLKRVLTNPQESDFAKETARKAIDRIERGPDCRWCLEPERDHNGAVCRVLARFRMRAGKGSFPTEGQAADIRAQIANDDLAKAAAERRKDARSRQGSFGF